MCNIIEYEVDFLQSHYMGFGQGDRRLTPLAPSVPDLRFFFLKKKKKKKNQ